ncbi:unnamed protein product [Periconia digitata]|uniref:GPI anchored protein n=1 Tax=Periconia digitata TaxID=1303443 RepID=A0A9W4ULP3_9PLEO|nr:unnamed protein product [Periconia digitata]
MKLTNLLSLPPTVILLCASPIVAELVPKQQQWPHNLPNHLKYFPEDEMHVKRGLEVQARMMKERPIGVKKMSGDEGEMFFLDNWIFAPDHQNVERQVDEEELSNVTSQIASPLRPHSSADYHLRFRVRDVLMQRDFKCPSGTNDCSSIGAPDSCCGTSQTCISIQDTGTGPVGCCSEGQQCEGSISCDTANGYTSCPNSPNGGCCLPGYSCQDVGCVIAGTSVTYVQPSTSSTRSTSSAPPPTSATPTPTSTSAYTCSTGWFSCAASLGGGCCQNGRTCATGASCVGSETSTSTSSASSTAPPSAPVRPTGGTDSNSQSTSGSPTESLCPTGFYACQAFYPSGCCRIGRDCQTTGSCILPTPSSTLVNSNGITIVVPSGGSFATTAPGQGGSCPSAWYSCPASRGGNCCPEGYSCGEQCTATSGTGVSGKVAPSQAVMPSVGLVWGFLSSALAVGVAMIVL